MPESRDQSPGEDYFNDLSQQPRSQSTNDDTQRQDARGDGGATGSEQIPKPKRIACVLCRKRKLRCDRNRPACATCARLQHECSYDEVRRKSGPKRGYVKALEARLAQVETLLKTQDDHAPSKGDKSSADAATAINGEVANGAAHSFTPNVAIGSANVDMLPHLQHTHSQHDFPPQATHPHTMLNAAGAPGTTATLTSEEPFPWEMIGLGLDEPLPAQDVVNELNRTYFDKIHPSLPMIHRPRYHAAMHLAPHLRPPVCLRYAMWCNAAAASDKYEALQEHFYHRARKYIQQDEMKGHGESMITIAHCQTWVLLGSYEFKLMYFPRAWVSAGRACRLAQMMGLHRLDGNGLDVKQCLPPPKDWTEREERRRTFWMSFCVDRYSSIGTGWPMTIEERDIMTNLPSTEEAFELSRTATAIDLCEALKPDGPHKLSSFAGVVVMACLFGRNLTHLHRPSPDDNDDDLNGEFWKRHREMDNILSNTSLSLPAMLRLPLGLNNPNTVFLNMNIHTSTICLHQAAIFKADKNRMPARIATESKMRCITAAAEISSIMRQVSHIDLSGMNPFISFCLYVAARVFVQYLKSRPGDQQVRASLQFLLQAMHAIKRRNPLTESFLVQLDVDLEGAGLEDTRSLRPHADPRLQTSDGTNGCCSIDRPAMEPKITFGDPGLGLYNHPNQEVDSSSGTPYESGSSRYSTNPKYNADRANVSSATNSATPQSTLPTRQRTPGSVPGSMARRSPRTLGSEMDTSPDGSGGEQQTPASSAQHSTSACSPPQELHNGNSHTSNSIEQNATSIDTMFDPTSADFTNDFVFATPGGSSHERGFVLPQTWAGVGESVPASGPIQGLVGPGSVDMMGMSDADWTQVLDSFNTWETGLSDDHVPQQVHFGRRP